MSTKRKLPTKLGVPLVKPSAKDTSQTTINESKAVVSQGGSAVKPVGFKPGEVVDISSESSSEEEDDSDDDFEHRPTQLSDAEEDVTMLDADASANGEQHAASPPEEDIDETAEPSFGDLLQAQHTEAIDVAAALERTPERTNPQTKHLQAPSGASLGTVLTQALRTNDVSMLESCLQTRDVSTIRATIQRLDSPLAGTLLQRLAERLHRRPGRAGNLLIWVQWTLVTHGGYLATQEIGRASCRERV